MHPRRGQALPEFAIVVPLFLLLLFGLIDFSRMLFTYMSITNGAREMARVVAITGPWVATQSACNTCVTTTVNAFNNLTILASPAVGVKNFSLSPGSGTISCASMSSSGCGLKVAIDYANLRIAFTPLAGQGGTGSATYTMASTAVPSLSKYGVSADGDYATVLMISEGSSIGSTGDGYLQICPLPMTTSCALTNLNMELGGGGIVEVDTSYTFHYSALFENRLSGLIDASFTRALTVLTTTTRTTGE
ncbi:MAG: pilus assembly protein [Chloroflexi bacterium]|nr:pilus assembly protein [Chloroflexota bacterium]